MGESTGISWTDSTFSPWWGCQRVSEACTSCYADVFAKRIGHGKRLPTIWGGASTSRRQLSNNHWANPIRWNREAGKTGERHLVFCGSMCDVFEDRPDLVAPRERLFKLIDATPNLTWQLLTKRPQNISRMVPRPWLDVPGAWPARVWAGTTVEDNVSADKRLPFLCDLPAPTKFVSYEPALEHVDFSPWLGSGRVTWLIFGGESGPHARPISLDWVSSFIVQGRAAGIAPFMKQMGERWAKDNRARHAHGADPMEWLPEYRVQEFPVGPARDEGYVSEMRRQLPMLA